MRKLLTVWFISIFVSMPTVARDLTSEWMCAKKQYAKLEKEWFLTIYTECKKYKIDPPDIYAIIEHESEWNKNIISKTWDFGLMQINRCHAPDNPEIFLNPTLNIQKGINEYFFCLKQSGGDKRTANRLYNAGRNSKAEKYTNWGYINSIDQDRISFGLLKSKFYVVK